MLSYSEKFAAAWGIYLIVASLVFFKNHGLISWFIEMLSFRVQAILGGALIILGFIHIYYHNLFDESFVTIITLIGYIVFTKGILLLLFPKVINLSKYIVNSRLINYIIFVILLLGIYLVNAAFKLQDFSL